MIKCSTWDIVLLLSSNCNSMVDRNTAFASIYTLIYPFISKGKVMVDVLGIEERICLYVYLICKPDVGFGLLVWNRRFLHMNKVYAMSPNKCSETQNLLMFCERDCRSYIPPLSPASQLLIPFGQMNSAQKWSMAKNVKGYHQRPSSSSVCVCVCEFEGKVPPQVIGSDLISSDWLIRLMRSTGEWEVVLEACLNNLDLGFVLIRYCGSPRATPLPRFSPSFFTVILFFDGNLVALAWNQNQKLFFNSLVGNLICCRFTGQE